MLSPDRCLKRWCRICGMAMISGYGFDSEYRMYDFYCVRCDTLVRIWEETSYGAREILRRYGVLLEPLTREEEEKKYGKTNLLMDRYLETSKKKGSQNIEQRLTPDKCLRRWCRICETEMELEYESNPCERLYAFHCTRCKTTACLSEEILKDMRKGYAQVGCPLEPLTSDEEAAQAAIAERDNQSFEMYTRPEKKGLGGKGIAYDKKTGYKLSDDEAEKLR